MSFIDGFMSLFSWMFSDDRSPSERVDEMLDEFYNKYPWIERDDNAALIKDHLKVFSPNDEHK